MRYALILLLAGCSTSPGWVIEAGPYRGPRPPEVTWERKAPMKAPAVPNGVAFNMCVA